SVSTLAVSRSLANVTNRGRLRPGDGGSRVLTVNGSCTFSTSAIMFVDLDGTGVGSGYDQFVVTGSVDLTMAADLNISRDPGFIPAIGTAFTILNKTSGGASPGNVSGLPLWAI